MFDIIAEVIGYTGTSFSNIDSYIVYASIVLVLLVATIGIDFIFHIIMSFFPTRKELN